MARGLTVATAESCTGGLVAHLITEVPGIVGVPRGRDRRLLGRGQEPTAGRPRRTSLEAHGAVSAQVAIAMAEGARDRLRADLGVGVTGVAGPDGGTEAKPVGLVYVAVAGLGRRDGAAIPVAGRSVGEQARLGPGGARDAARARAGRRPGRQRRPRRPAAPGEPAGAAHDGPRRGRGRRRPRAGAGAPADRGGGADPRGRGGRGRGVGGGPAGVVGRRARSTAATPAVRARTRPRSTPPASPSRRATIRRTSRGDRRPGPARRHQGAHGRRSRATPSSRRRGRPGSRIEPWQQVVADAAAGRRLVGDRRARTARARRRAGWSTSWRRPAWIPGRSSGRCCRRR